MCSFLYILREVIFRRWIVIMIYGWMVLMWIWCLFVKIDERGSFLDNVDLNQEPLVLDTLSLTKIRQDVSQAPVRHSSGLSIKYPDCGKHYSEFIQWAHDLEQKKLHQFMPLILTQTCLPPPAQSHATQSELWLVPGLVFGAWRCHSLPWSLGQIVVLE